MIDTIGERIRWALKQRGISAARLGRHLGVTRASVSQWCSRIKPTSPNGRIEQICDFLNVHVEWLLTGRGEAMRDSPEIVAATEGAPASAPNISGARLVGMAEAEAWRESPSVLFAPTEQSGAPIGQSLNRSNIADMHQFVFEVRGNSVSQTMLPGEYAICVEYRHARPAGPQQEDLVVVKKRRGVKEYKIFIARLRYRENTWQLSYESNDPRWQARTIRLSADLTRDTFDNCQIDIVGYVFGIFRANPQPMFGVRHPARAHENAN